MACRKAAYRAMTDLSEFMEKQQEEAARTQEAFEAEQRKLWTPADVFDRCCSQWLAHGHEVQSHRAFDLATKRGCSGGCLKDHPRITLDFDKGVGAVAKISHPLVPFQKYFEEMMPLQAIRISALKYELKGLLSTHAEIVKARFGSHLIKVAPSALAASQRAQERQLEHEELERLAKRRKIQGKAADSNLLESVLEICCNHSLLDHLDVADIAWMRLSCKALGKIAAKLARTRMKQIGLSYSVLLDGHAHESQNDVESFVFVPGCPSESCKEAASHQPLSLAEGSTDTFCPIESAALDWETLTRPGADYRGEHVVRVYLEGNGATAPERDVIFGQPIEVARYRINPKGLQAGVHHNSLSKLAFHVVSNHEEQTDDGLLRKGTFALQSIGFGFQDLLGIYVRKKLPVAKAKYQSRAQKTPAEKQYVKALAKAAREAPGSATAFRGMSGW